MNRTSWKCLVLGVVAAAALLTVVPQADACWWRWGGCGWGCCSSCYSCYTPCCSTWGCGYGGCGSGAMVRLLSARPLLLVRLLRRLWLFERLVRKRLLEWLWILE